METIVKSNAAKLNIITKTNIVEPKLNYKGGPSGVAHIRLDSSMIKLAGTVILDSNDVKIAPGWTFGFLQIMYTSNNWALYRGQSNNQGSVFVDTGKAMATPICRDTLESNTNIFWYNTELIDIISKDRLDGKKPIILNTQLLDKPWLTMPLIENNSITKQTNFLHEIKVEYAFCTVLALRKTKLVGPFISLLHLYWTLNWHYRVKPTIFEDPAYTKKSWVVNPVSSGCGSTMSPIYNGIPTNTKYQSILYNYAHPQSCNANLGLALNSPIRNESKIWLNK